MRRCVLLVLACLVACSSSSRESPATGSGSAQGEPVVPSTPLPALARWEPLTGPFLATRVHGGDRKCAVARDGRVACWGALGGRDATRIETGVPHRLAGVDDAVDV